MFLGFAERSFDFLWELKLNNERTWFQGHKQEFEELLNQPIHALALDTLSLLRERFPNRDFQVHISRIYRDARRLFGKGPFFDSMWFTMEENSPKERGPRFHFHIDHKGYSHGLNYWDASARYAEVFRKQIDADPERFSKILSALPDYRKAYLEGGLYKRPKGSLGARIDPWYNRKNWDFTFDDYFGDEIYGPELPEHLAESYCGLLPLYDYLRMAYNTWVSELEIQKQINRHMPEKYHRNAREAWGKPMR